MEAKRVQFDDLPYDITCEIYKYVVMASDICQLIIVNKIIRRNVLSCIKFLIIDKPIHLGLLQKLVVLNRVEFIDENNLHIFNTIHWNRVMHETLTLKDFKILRKELDWILENEIRPENVNPINWARVIDFVTYGADIHLHNDLVLIQSIRYNAIHVTKFLLEHGANVDARGGEPLLTAIQPGGGYKQLIRLLLEYGANVHARDDAALIYSVRMRSTQRIQLLLKYGANLHAQNDIIFKILDKKSKDDNRILKSIEQRYT